MDCNSLLLLASTITPFTYKHRLQYQFSFVLLKQEYQTVTRELAKSKPQAKTVVSV